MHYNLLYYFHDLFYIYNYYVLSFVIYKNIMFIGIDLGTSSIKTILIDENQNTLSSHTENIELLNPKIGFYEQTLCIISSEK